MGFGEMMVVFVSVEMSLKVSRYLNWRAVGDLEMMSGASRTTFEDSPSSSTAMILVLALPEIMTDGGN